MFNPTSHPFVSSGAFKSKTTREIVDDALSCGVPHVELGSGILWNDNVLPPLFETNGHGVTYLVHNYFPPHKSPFVLNLASSDDVILKKSLNHCKAAIDLSAQLTAPFFSVHAGFAFNARPDELGQNLTNTHRVSLEISHAIFVKSLQDLCIYAASKGITVLVENNVIAPFNLIGGKNRLGLCATATEILQTYREVGQTNFGFLVDVGHLKVTANALGFDANKFLDNVGSYVHAFHLSDNDGNADQNLSFDDSAWFMPRLAEFPRAFMILEAYNLEFDHIRSACRTIERGWHRTVSI